jgi:chaperone BCS1
MLETLQATFAGNPFFSGGLLLGAMGMLALWLRDVPGRIASWGRQFFVVTLSFDSRDELMFTTLVEYMHAQDALRDSHNFTVRAVRQGPAYQNLADELQQGGRPEAYLSPGEGFHIFRLNGHWMWMQREVQVAANIIEKITLSMLGRDRKPMEAFVQDALEHRMARELNRVAIYIPSPYTNEWQRARLGNHRRLDSIVLMTGQTEAIVADLRTFFASRLRYENLGIPWRRGYLLHGPPGTGKTSLVTALASEMALNVCKIGRAHV